MFTAVAVVCLLCLDNIYPELLVNQDKKAKQKK